MNKSIVVLSGITANNLGDDAMLVATVQALRLMHGHGEIVVLAEDPAACEPVAAQIDAPILRSLQRYVQDTLETLRPDESPAMAMRRLAREIRRGRGAIASGRRPPWLPEAYMQGLSLLLGADGVLDCGGASLGVHWKSYFYEKCLDYSIAARPLFVLGQGVDPVGAADDCELLRTALSRATEVTLREPLSERYLRSIGCTSPMLTTGDDALTLETSSPEACARLLDAAGVDRAQPFLAFQYRHYLDYEDDRDYDVFAACVDEAISATGLPVVGVPMHFGGLDERDHLAEIRRRLAHAPRFHVVQDHLTPSDAKAIFAAATAAFGISYHSAVFALSSGTPYLGLYRGTHYAQKMRGLAERYDLPDLPVAVDERPRDALGRLLAAQIRERERIRSHLLARHEVLADAVTESRRRFLDRLHERSRVSAAPGRSTPP